MTGQGHASAEGELGAIRVEVRTVNNRGLKCSLRISDSLASLEAKIDALVRSLISRGSVTLSVSWRKPAGESIPSIDVEVLTAYAQKLSEVKANIGEAATFDLASLLNLPGVISSDRGERREDDALWQFVRGAIDAAMSNLDQMRRTEGSNMATSLRADAGQIADRLEQVRLLAPDAAENYQNRLEAKIRRILTERDIESQPIDLLREVQIYADRVDISEEVTRLESHLQMFDSVLDGNADRGGNGKVDKHAAAKSSGRPEPMGRKLDFVIQEMFRETNTIGSKASDSSISAHVVEIKCAIERMRELVQNLE
jgi:uncharacterized protein (TIGR00255 family)